jgi:molybdopterin/thiamine biosynthesis adenylyltransferase
MSAHVADSHAIAAGDLAFAGWSYREAFSRHEGLVSPAEQERLRTACVAIIGMGGVGGVHLMTLARMGIGAFRIADPDVFETANFNRQYGATLASLGRSKVEVMAELARGVNPEVEIHSFAEPVGESNVARFLDGADVLVDGVDFFEIAARRLVFREARKLGLWGVTAGPHAFGTGWLTFSPDGMTFDEYFDLDDSMDESEQIIAFAVGGTPSPLHLAYLDLSKFFRPQARSGGSVGFACHLASGVVAAEVLKILLDRGPRRPAPWYFQFDAYRQAFRSGRLWRGNRHPLQRLKRWWLLRKMRGMRRQAALERSGATQSD